jgi:hypothetical protein
MMMLLQTLLSISTCAATKRGRALKYFTAVCKHYDDMEEDQFDFHSYCLRKMTLRSYVHLLVWA